MKTLSVLFDVFFSFDTTEQTFVAKLVCYLQKEKDSFIYKNCIDELYLNKNIQFFGGALIREWGYGYSNDAYRYNECYLTDSNIENLKKKVKEKIEESKNVIKNVIDNNIAQKKKVPKNYSKEYILISK